MSEVDVTLRPAVADSLPNAGADGSDIGLTVVERLLSANDLPTADVRSKPESFYVAMVDGDVVGAGGLESFGTDGLLRSVVVARDARGRGIGTGLCEALETEARSEGVGSLYLLTTTAASFFANRGYDAVDRSTVPAAVRRTDEFADLCPRSADVMQKLL